jgi:metal-sulfur cluster biosynthetic enzyme
MSDRDAGNDLEHQVRQALRGVIDPEIGRSVVDIGLIYDIGFNRDGTLVIDMTTTTRGCPAAGYLVDAVRERAADTGLAGSVDVRLTYDPPWTPDMMLP